MKKFFVCLTIFVAFWLMCFGWYRFTPNNRFSSASLRALRQDPDAVIYTIDPWPSMDQAHGFRGYKIIGQHRLTLPSDREAIVDMIASATRGAWDQAECFEPRHALRARGSKGVYDFLLCFECDQAVVYDPDGKRKTVLITGEPDELNEFLRANSVKLSEN